MHLPELPTIFVKGGEERKVYFTVQARELLAAGWAEKKEPESKAEVKPAPNLEIAEEPAEEISEPAKPAPKAKAKKIEAEPFE